MEIQGVNTTRNDLFPFSALRVLGGMQIFLGTVCVLLGVLDLAMMMLHYEEQASRYAVTPQDKAMFDTLMSMTVASAPIWCGTWVSVVWMISVVLFSLLFVCCLLYTSPSPRD